MSYRLNTPNKLLCFGERVVDFLSVYTTLFTVVYSSDIDSLINLFVKNHFNMCLTIKVS